jgi:transposase, IS5 family
VEHVFARQKNRFGLFIRAIGIARAEAKLTLANIAYNFNRLRWFPFGGQIGGFAKLGSGLRHAAS